MWVVARQMVDQRKVGPRTDMLALMCMCLSGAHEVFHEICHVEAF